MRLKSWVRKGYSRFYDPKTKRLRPLLGGGGVTPHRVWQFGGKANRWLSPKVNLGNFQAEALGFPELSPTGFPAVLPVFRERLSRSAERCPCAAPSYAQKIQAEIAGSSAKTEKRRTDRLRDSYIALLKPLDRCLCTAAGTPPTPRNTFNDKDLRTITSPMIYHRRSEHRESVALSLAARIGIAPS